MKGRKPPGKHSRRGTAGQFAPGTGNRPEMRPHHPKPQLTQVQQTAGTDPDTSVAPSASVPADPSIDYAGESPEGYDPYTLGTQY